ncbi:MAG TPA: alginate lyase family protein [Acidobacteriaceae bacterium]
MQKQLTRLILAASLIGISSTAHAAPAISSIFPAPERIAAAGALPDWGGFRTSCQQDLKMTPYPLGDFSPSDHYDSKGESPIVSKAQIALHKESYMVYRLGVCYQISHDRKYAAKAESILDSWATTLTRIGTDQGEDEFNFFTPFALASAYALKSDPAWDSTRFALVVRQRFVPALHTKKANNHGNWGVLLELTAGSFLDDAALIDSARDRWLELMRNQVASDGSLPLEICRSDTTNWCGGPTKGIKGISYEHWTLLPVTIAAEIFKTLGMDVYTTPEGALLHKAYAKVAAWTLHPETFPYYAANGGHLLGVRNDTYFYILQQVFPEADAATLQKSTGGFQRDDLNLSALYGTPKLSTAH